MLLGMGLNNVDTCRPLHHSAPVVLTRTHRLRRHLGGSPEWDLPAVLSRYATES